MEANGLIPSKGLNAEQLRAIKELAHICNQHDQIRLKLNWDALELRNRAETNDWLYYKDGKLVGFLGLYYFSMAEAEFSGMVHPSYRRQGIFQLMVNQARLACLLRGFPKMIFMNQRGSTTGRAFLAEYGARYLFSEHWMEYNVNFSEYIIIPKRADLLLRENIDHEDDLETLIRIQTLGFGMDEEDVRDHLMNAANNAHTTTLIVYYNGFPIGSIRYQNFTNVSFIYGFCILPEYRGLGIGRYTLLSAIKRIRHEVPQYDIVLEVEVENKHALELYQSCGFYIDNINDYYVMDLS
ncbi:GNAT family N-acetyltransferase [Paenibacillus albiflavus]|nr:GNAT family N-acetyltransferase [Paenibacillus albiflavus]